MKVDPKKKVRSDSEKVIKFDIAEFLFMFYLAKLVIKLIIKLYYGF